MITYVTGNILTSAAQVISNPINCVGVMGAGLALEFKNNFPDMYADYSIRCSDKKVVIGQPYLWESNDKQILNFPTKRHFKDKSLLGDIDAGLAYLASNYEDMGITSIALPALGCGLGGLNWSDVKLLIEKHLSHLPTLEVYVYQPAVSTSSVKSKEESGNKSVPAKDKAAAASL